MQGFSIQRHRTVKEWSFFQSQAVNVTHLVDVRRPSRLSTKAAPPVLVSSYQEPSHSWGWPTHDEFGVERNGKQQHFLRMGFCVTEYKGLISDFIMGKEMTDDQPLPPTLK